LFNISLSVILLHLHDDDDDTAVSTVVEIIKPQIYHSHNLDLLVTSSVTWPFDSHSHYAVSYRCSIDNDLLS